MTTGRGHYDTRQRRAIVHALAQVPGFVSAQQLHARMRQADHTIALTTIYRALRIYADAGLIATTHDASGQQVFQLGPGSAGSHYLVCHTCGDSVPVETDIVQEWAGATAAAHSFTDIHLIVELSGRCPACNADASGN